MTTTQRYLAAMFLIVVITSDVHTAEYADYDGASSDLNGHQSSDPYENLQQSEDLSNTKLWNIPLEHLMVRKSQRSPSLRLRFGRRSDPLMTQNEISESFISQDPILERKSVRSPSYRLRFGRRSDSELSEDLMSRKASRSPSLRLRFGRRSDPLMTHDFTNSFLSDDDYVDKKIARSPSYRLRFGRESDSSPISLTNDLSGSSLEKGESLSDIEDN